MAGLERFHFNVADEYPATRGFDGRRSEMPPETEVDSGFTSDEAAARFHLSRLLAADSRPTVRGITAPERPERVPDLHLVDSKDQPGIDTRLVRFEQTQDEVPIFGARAVCELTHEHGFVSASGRVGTVEGVSSFPEVSQEDARRSIASFAEVEPSRLESIAPARLNYFLDDQDKWHLVWLFEKVPAAPPEFLDQARGHGLGGSPRTRNPRVDYLVDAHSAEIVFYFSANPLFAMPLPPIPVRGTGVDEEGNTEALWGQMVGTEFELSDPLRDIRTYDLAGGDIDTATLGGPYRAPNGTLGATCKAIVSAHATATKVYDFFNSVLLRDGIDDAGMELINVVNCTSPADEPPPAWHNAVWWLGRMWYGQLPGPDGTLVSYARYVDVIAHELTHGVTQSTANLVYKNQPGALNESVSDIFGIIVKNWDWGAKPPEGGDASTWDWELGSGLGDGGLPLRDMSDPTRTNDPANMSDYDPSKVDNGGVHTNSNIHNKAAHNVLTATDSAGEAIFTPREVALLYYLALTRLGRMDGFPEMLIEMVAAATSMYAANAAERSDKTDAIRTAYQDVGIT